MGKAKPVKKGDACPQCGGELKEHPEPSDAQRAAAADRENPVPFPPHLDSATKDQRAELGALYSCRDCTYRTRVKSDAKPDDAAA